MQLQTGSSMSKSLHDISRNKQLQSQTLSKCCSTGPVSANARSRRKGEDYRMKGVGVRGRQCHS